MTTLQDRLARLKNYSTRYELLAIHRDYKVLLCYTSRRTRAGVVDAIRNRGAELVALTGSENFTFGKNATDGVRLGEWTIKFTGRTQRECIIQDDEYPFILDVAAAKAVQS